MGQMKQFSDKSLNSEKREAARCRYAELITSKQRCNETTLQSWRISPLSLDLDEVFLRSLTTIYRWQDEGERRTVLVLEIL